MSDRPYAESSKLRVAVAAMSSELERLPEQGSSKDDRVAHRDELFSRWNALLGVLALGLAPELRHCPACGETIMHTATRCRACWSRVVPLSGELT